MAVGFLLNPILAYVNMNKSDSSYAIPASLQPHYTANTWKTLSPVLHKFWHTLKIPVLFERKHPQYKINCRIAEPQSLAFPRLQFQY